MKDNSFYVLILMLISLVIIDMFFNVFSPLIENISNSLEIELKSLMQITIIFLLIIIMTFSLYFLKIETKEDLMQNLINKGAEACLRREEKKKEEEDPKNKEINKLKEEKSELEEEIKALNETLIRVRKERDILGDKLNSLTTTKNEE